MKVLKRPSCVIYDTDDVDSRAYYPYSGFGHLVPLNYCHEKTDYEFLLVYFPKEHPVFNDFGLSYYYVLANFGINDKIAQKLKDKL